jgi:hypothetical protein
MEIVDLICRDRRSLKYGESCVREDSLTCLSSGPVLPGHVAVVRGGRAPRKAVTLIIGAHSVEAAAATQFSLEVINAGQLYIGPGWLIVIAIFIKPRDGIWAWATV